MFIFFLRGFLWSFSGNVAILCFVLCSFFPVWLMMQLLRRVLRRYSTRSSTLDNNAHTHKTEHSTAPLPPTEVTLDIMETEGWSRIYWTIAVYCRWVVNGGGVGGERRKEDGKFFFQFAEYFRLVFSGFSVGWSVAWLINKKSRSRNIYIKIP